MEICIRGKPPHRTPQWVETNAAFFITINCQKRGVNQLCLPAPANALLTGALTYHTQLKWNCLVMMLMPDHLHAILAFPREPGMVTTLRSWKRFMTRMHGICWQENFFDHRLRTHWELIEKKDYILNNPVRKGLVQNASDWPWKIEPIARMISFQK